MMKTLMNGLVGSCLGACVLFCGGVVRGDESGADRPEKPNVILILVDDLGWQDVKCYDVDEASAYDTPYLDAFAKKGVMFWQAYSPAPSCSPSRCAIISGNHPARAQKTHVLGGRPPYASTERSVMMDPWFSGRMPEDTFTLARAMKANGYVTGHAGKWHIAIDHHAFPQPGDVGFDFTRSTRGAHSGRGLDKPLEGFATKGEKDPYRLDENGFPYHQNNEDALDFIRESKGEPFFLYYCTWLVHSPIVTRNERLLKKYAERMGGKPEDMFGKKIKGGGQKNPYYGAMVESLDYYLGQVISYVEETEDPRWPGHMLSENTYIVFTSDNGGVVGYTDNAPLDLGKTSAKEGGTRVPLLIVGPKIKAGVESNVMVNGLDFYPTFVSLAGGKLPEDKGLDGCDLVPLLMGDATDGSLVKGSDGEVRDVMVWHFPHNADFESTIIEGGYKLIRNYDHVGKGKDPALELFQLYDEKDGRVDIEEGKNLAKEMPEKVKQMDQRLTGMLTEMDASYPSFNPYYKGDLANKDKIPTVVSVDEKGGAVSVQFKENGAKVKLAYLIYTLNGGEKAEEWFRAPVGKVDGGSFSVDLPKGTTHYFVNLIDENEFLVSYPSVKGVTRKNSKVTGIALTPGE
ncbi:MAG: sulfatase [Akkermansiaceae bacterium]